MLNYLLQIVVVPIALLLGMTASLYLGARLRRRQPEEEKDEGQGDPHRDALITLDQHNVRPGAIFFLLLVVMVLCSMLAGYRMGAAAQWNGLHRLAFVTVLALTYFVIIDLEYPRVGVLNLTDIDAVMVNVRKSL